MKFHPASYCIRCGTAVVLRFVHERQRPVCPACGWIHFSDPKVAVEILVKQAEKVLLVRRLNDPGKGLWSLPGGYMDSDESPIQAAERECREETGLEVQVTGLIDVMQDREFPASADVVIAYAASILGGELRGGDDAAEAAFFPYSALPPIAFKVARKVLELE